jgi:ribosome-associated heat shock protein Hsp15
VNAPAKSERIDKWLWYARFAKTRGLAQKLIARGQVTINGQKAAKSSALVRAGDSVAVVQESVKRKLIVKDTGERRGPAEEARLLYDEPQPVERLVSEDAALPLYRPMLVREKGAGRPTKKDRRDLAQELGWNED